MAGLHCSPPLRGRRVGTCPCTVRPLLTVQPAWNSYLPGPWFPLREAGQNPEPQCVCNAKDRLMLVAS